MSGKGNMQNLRPPWKPGESGNPSGRPKKRPISDSYAEFAQRPLPEKLRRELGLQEGVTFAEAQTMSLFTAAAKGSVTAAREIREAIEGKANERWDPKVPENATIRVVYGTREPKPASSPETTEES
jgi:hypothetical protein